MIVFYVILGLIVFNFLFSLLRIISHKERLLEDFKYLEIKSIGEDGE